MVRTSENFVLIIVVLALTGRLLQFEQEFLHAADLVADVSADGKPLLALHVLIEHLAHHTCQAIKTFFARR
jgi:hypothetical protein